MAATFPGGGANTYVPSHDATAGMVVDFSRNPDSFKINQYVQIVPVDKDNGLYLKMTVEEAGRVLDSSGHDHAWPYGVKAPQNNGNTEGFEFLPYACHRRQFGYNIPLEVGQQASWDILSQHGRIKAQQAMTVRTQRMATLLQTSGNYPSGHTGAVTGLGSVVTGKWDVSTTARMDIKKSLDYGKEQIHKSTLGGVNLDDIKLVLSPGCARAIASTQEIVDHIKGSPTAIEYIKGEIGPNAQYGLPKYLYGTEVVVEDAVKVTTRKGATTAKSYVWSDTAPLLIARPGELVNETDTKAPRFAAATLFMFEEMTVESRTLTWDRLEEARVVENYDEVLTAGIAAFLFTAAIN